MVEKKTLDQIAQLLNALSDEDLSDATKLIQAIQEAREEKRAVDSNPTEEQATARIILSGHQSRKGYIEEKMIKNCGPYQYLRWRDGKTKKSTYLGKVPAATSG
jgi:hypothetical protein